MQPEEIINAKQKLIAQLDELVQNEQQIGKAIQQKKDIQNQWNLLEDNGSQKVKQLNHQFYKLIEDFNYNINIYKAIQEHDLKRNQQIKEEILTKLNDLLVKDQKIIESLRVLQKEWYETGPVKRELREEIWQKFKDVVQKLNEKLETIKGESKQKEVENLQKKQEIISFIHSLLNELPSKEKHWKIKTDLLLTKQNEWKQIGHVPKESTNDIWNQYRSACDNFFTEKSKFYDVLKESYKIHKKQKTDLLDEVNRCVQNTSLSNDEKANTLTKLQRRWKETGQVHPRDEQKLWMKFQNDCNQFFESLRKVKEEQKTNNQAAYSSKKELINLFTQTTSREAVEEIIKKWYLLDSIKVPNEISNPFFDKANELLLSYGINREQASNLKFNLKLQAYSELKNADLFQNESGQLREHISKLEEEKNKFENNLGFFKNAKKDNPMLIELNEKVNKMNADIAFFKDRLTMLKKAMKA